MAREKKSMFDDMREAMGEKPTESRQHADDTPTIRRQHADLPPATGPMKDYRVRMPESWWAELTAQATAQGMQPSQLLRQILADWLRH